jgi:hypothetical protein
MRIDRKGVLALVGGWTLYCLLGSQIGHLHPLIDSIVLAEFALRAIKPKNLVPEDSKEKQ